MIGIIPVAGNATRMGGFLKFLLPVPNQNQTLISWHIENQLKICEKVIIATKAENATLFKFLTKNEKICVFIVETETMSETVINVVNAFPSEEYVLGMPDTFCFGENPYDKLNSLNKNDIEVCLWSTEEYQIEKLGQVLINKNNEIIDVVDKNKNFNYPFIWGIIKFKKSFINFFNKELSHIGLSLMPAITGGMVARGIVIKGKYFDCGTLEEYNRLINHLYENI